MSRTAYSDYVAPVTHEVNGVTKSVEHFMSQIPSEVYLTLAMVSIGFSAVVQLSGRKKDSTFIGHWVPTFLLLGLYNKIAQYEHKV